MTEDWDRISDMDRMYLYEMEKQLEEEYWRWCDEQETEFNRLPAKITVYKLKEDEVNSNSVPF